MPVWICTTCGNHYPESAQPPGGCVICNDERQYVPPSGQAWTTTDRLRSGGHHTGWAEVEPGLRSLTVAPAVGIGHRGLLVLTAGGNVLFDPPGYLDDEAVAAVRAAGGLVAIARSHPHLSGAQVEWSQALAGADGPVPIWVAAADRRWVTRPDPAVRLFTDTVELVPGVRLVRCGGHFAGSAVLHWREGAEGRGTLLVGDTLMVCPDHRSVSFMRSYPMMLPLPERYLDRLLAALAPLAYDRIHGAFAASIDSGAADALTTSAHRGHGIARAALEGAVEQIAEAGGGLVEAIPDAVATGADAYDRGTRGGVGDLDNATGLPGVGVATGLRRG